MLLELLTQGEKPKFCRKVVKLPSSSQTGLVFPNLTSPTKIHSTQESLFWIFSFLDGKVISKKPVPSFLNLKPIQHPLPSEFPEQTARD